MFWNNPFFWIGFVIILVLVGLGLAYAIFQRRKRLENRFTVAIENGGNVVSRYLLRLDNSPEHSLVYTFAEKGKRLPVERIAGLPGSSQSAAPGKGNIAGAVDQLQSAGYTVTQYGPSAVSSPIVEANSYINEGERELGTIQYYLRKLGIAGGSPKPAEAQAASTPQGDDWALTGEIQPGTVLPVELTVRKKGTPDPQGWPFWLISRSKEDEKVPEVTVEGAGVVVIDFWTRPFVPELLVIGAGILLVIVMALLTSIS